jgi:altronate dehydratase
MSAPRALVLSPTDGVAVALADLAAGERPIDDGPVLVDAIPRGHKFARRAHVAGETVAKYGLPIGTATRAIPAGAHVHVHNLGFDPSLPRPEVPAGAWDPTRHAGDAARTFAGFHRADGRVGTRNFIGILTTVNCSATVAKQVARHFGEGRPPGATNVDGVAAFTHTSGCGMAHAGEGIELLQRTVAGYAKNPNFGGVLLIGLGCEVNQMARLLETQGLVEGPRLRTLGIQQAGGTREAIAQGIAAVEALIALADSDVRRPAPISALTLGLQCGGSDGWSGLSANPALGVAADRLVAAGARVVLSETPEIYGAESLLLARAETPAVAEALRARLAWWEAYAEKHGTDLNNNPSPGNIAGGLTTILEKSLGAVAKAGRAPLRAVLGYAETVATPGFQFMDTPGYDPCSATGQIAGGCTLLAFTTGRGAVFGAKPVPSLKLASNSALAKQQSDDIDLDCGGVLDGRSSLEATGAAAFERLLALASGEESASEKLGFGEAEFVPWQIGAVM